MATQALVEQVVKDLTALQWKNQPMFRLVEAGSGSEDENDSADHFKDTPHAMVRLEAKSSDEFEPELGEQDLIVKIFHRDHTSFKDGVKQQVSTGLRANYTQIGEHINNNYSYKAGGVYEAAMWLDGISLQSPLGDGLYSFEVTYKVLLG